MKQTSTLEADYLIIGSGAVGMAFADTLLTETDASIIIVDRNTKPGGHWVHAYPFVTLHQPSHFYGVNSKELSNGQIDADGMNKGLYSLASGSEICAYYESIMQSTFLASGRVQYFPLCDFKGNHQFESLINGTKYKVNVNKKLVDCSASASAISHLDTKAVFKNNVITPQTVRSYQPVFSAAVTAFVEANFQDNQEKNSICKVVPIPNEDTSWITMMLAEMANQFNWSRNKKMRSWLKTNRLSGFGNTLNNTDKNNDQNREILSRMRKFAMPAMIKLQKFTTALASEKQSQMENPQFQVDRKAFFKNRINAVPADQLMLETGEVLVKIEKFAYTANNITYAVAGDQIGYWQFFPAQGEQADGWGVIPVWGFAEVIASKTADIPIGDRLYGYFPPAQFAKMKPGKITATRFIETSAHRLALPAGYNFYRRVNNEPHYDRAIDQEMMLLFPLLLTAYCLWDALKEKEWFGAQQIIILSASSKTSIGLGYALNDDPEAPTVVGITSARNLENVQNLTLYDQSLTYDRIEEVANIPTVIVDMSGNAKVLAALHTKLGDHMKFTSNVGLTHWTDAQPQAGIIAERSKFFFAPSRIQKRMKEWGVTVFNQKTTGFMLQTALKTRSWLTYRQLDGLAELAAIHPDVCEGKMPSNEGLIVNIS